MPLSKLNAKNKMKYPPKPPYIPPERVRKKGQGAALPNAVFFLVSLSSVM